MEKCFRDILSKQYKMDKYVDKELCSKYWFERKFHTFYVWDFGRGRGYFLFMLPHSPFKKFRQLYLKTPKNKVPGHVYRLEWADNELVKFSEKILAKNYMPHNHSTPTIRNHCEDEELKDDQTPLSIHAMNRDLLFVNFTFPE